MLSRSLAEKVAYVTTDFAIKYPAFKEIASQARWMVSEPRPMRARGLIVCGLKGMGKTTLFEFLRDYYNKGGRKFLAAAATFEGVHGTRDVYGRVLKGLRCPVTTSHSVSDREGIVTTVLEEAGCRLLLLDEVQDIAKAGIGVQKRTCMGIKHLMNRVKTHVIAFGAEDARGALLNDPHLDARFTAVDLPSWEANQALVDFLATYERYLPFERPSGLWEAANVELLAQIGAGSLTPIVTRIRNAALHALANGDSFISRALLESAIDRPETCPLPEPLLEEELLECA